MKQVLQVFLILFIFSFFSRVSCCYAVETLEEIEVYEITENDDNDMIDLFNDSDNETEPTYPEGYEKDDNDKIIESWFEQDGPDINFDDNDDNDIQLKTISSEFKSFIIICIFALGLLIGCILGGNAFKWLN